MCRQKILIFGVTQSSFRRHKDDIVKILNEDGGAADYVYSGGERHRRIVADILPVASRWIEIKSPVETAIAKYGGVERLAIFASGDPLFYGIATAVIKAFPDADLRIYPTFNSLQTLCHRLNIPYGKMRVVSLTGRPWNTFDSALIAGEELIGVLTDRKKTPSAIARRMADFGFDNYRISIGQDLDSDDEIVASGLGVGDVADGKFFPPCCMVLQKERQRSIPGPGIPDGAFSYLPGRPKMITKMPARLVDISLMALREKKVLWDIGACTGSISIEAKLLFPHLHVFAFEKRAECEEIVAENCRKFGAPGIEIVIGDFFELELHAFPMPDVVFIGGYGGDLTKMIALLKHLLRPGVEIVFNSVSLESKNAFIDACRIHDLSIMAQHTLIIDSHNPLTIFKAIR